ncbi:MAG: sterol desaturase family protein [Sneathiellaceae bacterium]
MLDSWLGIVAHDVTKYGAAAGLAYLLLTLGVGRLRPHRRLQSRRPSGRQVRREVALSLVTAILFASVSLLAVILPAQAGWNRLYAGPVGDGWGYLLFSLVLMILVHDAWFYWIHRLMHQPALMARMHRTHHLSRTPTPWAAYAMAPAEAVLQIAFVPLFVLLVPSHPLMLLLWSLHMILRNAIGHAGVEVYPASWFDRRPFRWLTSTTHHDLHHETGRLNYGLYFTFWDRAMGTEHPAYRARFAAATGAPGTGGGPEPAGRRPAGAALLAALLAGGLALAAGQARAAGGHDAAILGEWVTPGHAARVALAPCTADPARLCGRIVWLWEATDAAGRPSDLLGRQVLSDFRPAGAGRYAGGRAQDPEDGQSYDAQLRLRSVEELEVEGCLLFLCRTQVWRRRPCPPG